MAAILSERESPPGWWPVDLLITSYLGVFGLVVLFAWPRLHEALWLAAAHTAGIALVVVAVRSGRAFLFRHWYPLPYVAACYKEMSLLIPALRSVDYDRELAALDYAIWRAYPTVWLERLHHPAFTELLQIVYSLFVPVVLLVAAIFWWQRRYGEFRYYAFLIAAGFLVSYLGYLAVPVRGPRFLLRGLQHFPLSGLWFFHLLQQTLDTLEAAHYDCFPSGHTELTLLAWWQSRRVSPNLFRAFSVYSILIIFSTLYLRYHYTVDIMAGVAVAWAVLWLSPRLYRRLEKVSTVWSPPRS